MNVSSLFFSLKRFVTKFLFETPRKENLTPLEMAILKTLASIAPAPIVVLMILNIQYVFWTLLLAWIPYSIWLALHRYYKWKDNKTQEVK